MSRETNTVAAEHKIKNNLNLIIFLSVKNLRTKYNNKYFKKKIDLITVEKYPFQDIFSEKK